MLCSNYFHLKHFLVNSTGLFVGQAHNGYKVKDRCIQYLIFIMLKLMSYLFAQIHIYSYYEAHIFIL